MQDRNSHGNGSQSPGHYTQGNGHLSRNHSYVPTRQGTSMVLPQQSGAASRMNSTVFPVHGGGSTVITGGNNAPGGNPPNGNFQNLFVSGLPQFVTDDILQMVFSSAGSIKSAKVMLDTTSGVSRGFGFVLFESQQEGCRAYGTLHNQLAKLDDGREFRIHAAPSQHDGKAAALESSVIYVRNIPSTVSEDRIQTYFCGLGTVVGCSVRTDSGNQEYRLATVEFKTISQAREAIGKTHNNKDIFSECDRPILAKFADSSQIKQERSQKKEQQWQHRWGGSVPPVPPPFGAVIGASPGLAASPNLFGPTTAPYILGATPTSPPPPPPPLAPNGLPQLTVAPPNVDYCNSLGSSALAVQLGGSVPQALGGSLHQPTAPNHASQQLQSVGNLEGTRQQLPDYVPLPLEPRGGFQQILFQGILGLTPDGRLYPVRVEQCSYVPTAPGGAPVFAPPGLTSGMESTTPTVSSLAASPSHQPALGSSYAVLGGSIHGPVGPSPSGSQLTEAVPIQMQDSGPTQQDMEQILTDLGTQPGEDVET